MGKVLRSPSIDEKVMGKDNYKKGLLPEEKINVRILVLLKGLLNEKTDVS